MSGKKHGNHEIVHARSHKLKIKKKSWAAVSVTALLVVAVIGVCATVNRVEFATLASDDIIATTAEHENAATVVVQPEINAEAKQTDNEIEQISTPATSAKTANELASETVSTKPEVLSAPEYCFVPEYIPGPEVEDVWEEPENIASPIGDIEGEPAADEGLEEPGEVCIEDILSDENVPSPIGDVEEKDIGEPEAEEPIVDPIDDENTAEEQPTNGLEPNVPAPYGEWLYLSTDEDTGISQYQDSVDESIILYVYPTIEYKGEGLFY